MRHVCDLAKGIQIHLISAYIHKTHQVVELHREIRPSSRCQLKSRLWFMSWFQVFLELYDKEFEDIKIKGLED